jgi:hypothetical protein
MKMFIAFALMCSLNSYAQSITDYNIVVDTRGNTLTETDVQKLQGRVKIGFTIDAAGVVEIVGLAASGNSYSNDWTTVRSSNNSNDHVNLAFRNLYLRKVMGKVTVEAGALNNEPIVGAAGLAPAGWVDGIRVKVNTKVGDFKVVAGSLGDFKQPDAFQRKFQGNFIEIEMDHKIFENLLSQTAVEHFNGDTYIRERLNLDLKILGDKVFKVFGDALYDVERKAFNYEVGAEFDVLKTIMNKYDHRLDFKVYYSNLDSRIPDRNSMTPAYYTYGPRITMQIGGKIDRAGNINWYTRAVIGKDGNNRYDAGITIKLGKKKN